jgi:hypothetical protein
MAKNVDKRSCSEIADEAFERYQKERRTVAAEAERFGLDANLLSWNQHLDAWVIEVKLKDGYKMMKVSELGTVLKPKGKK